MEVVVITPVPPFVCGVLDQPGPFTRPATRGGGAAPAQGGVPRRYPWFTATTGPAATLWPSTPLPTPTLLRGLSPRGQEGFSSFVCVTLLDVLPSLPRRSHRPVFCQNFPPTVLPSPFFERLDLRGQSITRLAQRLIPAARRVASWPKAKFVRRHRTLLHACSGASPQLRGSGSCHVRALTSWVTPPFWTRRRNRRTQDPSHGS